MFGFPHGLMWTNAPSIRNFLTPMLYCVCYHSTKLCNCCNEQATFNFWFPAQEAWYQAKQRSVTRKDDLVASKQFDRHISHSPTEIRISCDSNTRPIQYQNQPIERKFSFSARASGDDGYLHNLLRRYSKRCTSQVCAIFRIRPHFASL